MDKRQIDYPPAASERIEPDAARFVEAALEDIGIELDAPLEPRLETRFHRFTLSSREGPERLTCDLDVSLRGDRGERRLDPRLLLLEVKSESNENPIVRRLAEMGIEPLSLSKYKVGIRMLAEGVEGVDPDPSERFFD